jgi:hypothetical protein
MPIKLTPEHVGTRVLLDNGCIGVVTSYFKTMAGPRFEIAFGIVSLPYSMAVYDDDGIFERDEDHEQYPRGNTAKWRVALSLDGANPLDVPVPEWCWRIYVHRSPHSSAPPWVVHKSGWPDFLANPPIHVDGWSPAPGQLPPREAADDGE